MQRALEFDADAQVLDPAHLCLEQLEAFELHPDRLFELWTFHEFEFAAFGREVVGLDGEIMVPAAPKARHGPDLHALALSRRRNRTFEEALWIATHKLTATR